MPLLPLNQSRRDRFPARESFYRRVSVQMVPRLAKKDGVDSNRVERVGLLAIILHRMRERDRQSMLLPVQDEMDGIVGNPVLGQPRPSQRGACRVPRGDQVDFEDILQSFQLMDGILKGESI